MEARRKYHREYNKRWRHENPDKVKAINARFYAKKAAEMRKAAEDPGDNNDDGGTGKK